MAQPGPDGQTFPTRGPRDERGWQVIFTPKAQPEVPRMMWKIRIVERDPLDER